MSKTFNISGACRPDKHYMVDLESRLHSIKIMVDAGEYFSINRARQYGKTTLLRALALFLKPDYEVVSMDFQKISSLSFENEQSFVAAFSEELLYLAHNLPGNIKERFLQFVDGTARINSLQSLFKVIYQWCSDTEKPIVLIIDEVDTATNNQVFLDFLAQLRAGYLDSDVTPIFQSVILASVYDIRNIRKKVRPDEEHKQNSPWNITADFDINMSFSVSDIAGMLRQYESDYHTSMDIDAIATLLYDYTSGYPFLVSRLCKLMDEKLIGTLKNNASDFQENLAVDFNFTPTSFVSDNPTSQSTRNLDNTKNTVTYFSSKSDVWTKAGVLRAVNMLLYEKNSLFESLIGKLNDYPEMKELIDQLLFQGETILYNADDSATDMLLMFGFAKAENGTLQIANRIFETRLYNYFLARPAAQSGEMFRTASRNKNQFISNGQLNMRLLLEKFVEYFDDIYGDQNQKFIEEDGRRYFMLFLKPIINGDGNYYVESRTRNQERTDLIIDYHGTQYIIEMKIWHGDAYNKRGEEQLSAYLEHYHLKTGHMVSFNFNKNKKPGVKEITFGDKILIEAVV
ncbi:MAG: AAA-like domain-containing protein [Clostridiales bacterium]|nr:AAA-like domain-containing protein [Clostridiales bacterium]